MKRRLFLLATVFAILLTASCAFKKNDDIPPVKIDASNVDEYLLKLPEYDKISVNIDKSKFTEELTDEYITRYYERLAKDIDGLTDGEGNVLPLSDETIKRLNHPAFSNINEYKVFIRHTVEGFIDKENDDKKINAALKIMRDDAEFADIPESFVKECSDRILADYEEIAAVYDISSDDYFRLSEASLDDEAYADAQNELIFIKLADRIGLEYSNRDQMVKGVRDYLLSIIKLSNKK